MKKTSIRVKILVPVLLLFVISVMSNVLAINNLRKVNDMASVIADNYLGAITELDTIGQRTGLPQSSDCAPSGPRRQLRAVQGLH